MPPFKRIHREVMELTFADADTVKSALPRVEGLLWQITVVLPNFATAATAVLTITDKDGYNIYTSGSLAKNGTRQCFAPTSTFPVPIDSGCTFALTLNAGAGTNGGVAEVVAWVDGYKSGQ